MPLSKTACLKIVAEDEQLSFYLNNEVLVDEIQTLRKVCYSLPIPAQLLSHLRYYACFNDGLENCLQPSLTFCSYYYLSNLTDSKEDQTIVLRSVVSLDGDVIHQVLDGLLSRTDCLKVIATHHWLIGQILTNLRSDADLLIWQLTLFSPAATLAFPGIQLLFGSQVLSPLIQRLFWLPFLGILIVFLTLLGTSFLGITSLHTWLRRQFQTPFNREKFVATICDRLYQKYQVSVIQEHIPAILNFHRVNALPDIQPTIRTKVIEIARQVVQVEHEGRFQSSLRSNQLTRVYLFLSVVFVLLSFHVLIIVIPSQITMVGLLLGSGLTIFLWLMLARLHQQLVKFLQRSPALLTFIISSCTALLTFIDSISSQPLTAQALLVKTMNALLIALSPWIVQVGLKVFILPLMRQVFMRWMLSPNRLLRTVLKQLF